MLKNTETWFFVKTDTYPGDQPSISKVDIVQNSVGNPGLDGTTPSVQRIYADGQSQKCYILMGGDKYCKTKKEALEFLCKELNIQHPDDLEIINVHIQQKSGKTYYKDTRIHKREFCYVEPKNLE
jgi:hypothetical protein